LQLLGVCDRYDYSNKLTFAKYLQYNDRTDTQYQLLDGKLIPISFCTAKHGGISKRGKFSFSDYLSQRIFRAFITPQAPIANKPNADVGSGTDVGDSESSTHGYSSEVQSKFNRRPVCII
jgi:hypothetical protein